MGRGSACGPAVSGPAGRTIFGPHSHADAVKDVIDVNIPNRYGPIRVEDVQADDFIRPENPRSSKNGARWMIFADGRFPSLSHLQNLSASHSGSEPIPKFFSVSNFGGKFLLQVPRNVYDQDPIAPLE